MRSENDLSRAGCAAVVLVVIFLGIQCRGEADGKVIEVTGNKLMVLFSSHDSLYIGERFSLWRDERDSVMERTIRVAIIEIVQLVDDERAQAKSLWGHPRPGDMVRRWLIEEESINQEIRK